MDDCGNSLLNRKDSVVLYVRNKNKLLKPGYIRLYASERSHFFRPWAHAEVLWLNWSYKLTANRR